MTASGNITISTAGLVLNTETGPAPTKTPTALLTTRAVETKDGWLGQVVMSGEIVWETGRQLDSETALEEVNRHVLARFRRLIAGDPNDR